ncbi:hypothetical protein K9N68_22770 [Kovacikia minuta CCNUW1]|uniref:hypothetical protein n=1 Tax=Kovacikia minuta TaxID=2931930 RepID=UPI001CC9F745|nr:hypothetical protein [Kovacikia minuta]UBF24495.1 hypothetical protein K9N68_22770 [Kovacikia minuta CCNUW1]
MSAGFPWYFLVNDRPVKVTATPDGGMDVLILNLSTGELERDMAYLTLCFEPGQDVHRLSEEEFNTRLEAVKASQNSSD